MSRRRRRLSWAARRRIRLALLGVGVLVLLVGLGAGFRLAQAARHLRSAQHLLEQAGDAVEQGRIADARSLLSQASGRLSGASGSLHNHPELDVLRPLPVVGDNLTELRRAVGLAQQLSGGGERILAAAQPLQRADGSLEVPLKSGALPLDAMRAVQQEADLLVSALPEPRELRKDPGLLIGPVNELHDRVTAEVLRRRAQLQSLSDGMALGIDMAGGAGKRFYLIAVANTAEMRGSGGMILNYGGLVGTDGTFELTKFGRIDDLLLKKPLDRKFVPDLPEDYLRRWNGFDPLLRWRNANLAADFTVDAPVLEGMFGAAVGIAADGVIQIDPQGLEAILEGVGPVEVKGLGQVTVDNLVPLVLHDAYVKYPGIDSRSDVLKDVAEAAFKKLVTGQYDSLRPLGTALVRAVQGRHILFHARQDSTEEHIKAFGADGSLPDLTGPDAFHLTVQNVSGNKLDYFVHTQLGLSGDVRPAQPGQVRAEVLVQNTAPAGVTQPKYIFGPFNADRAGLYRGLVTLYLPRGTTLARASGDPTRDPPVVETEDGRSLVSYTVDLPAGTSSHVILDLQLPPRPDEPYELIAVPSPRVWPTGLRIDLDTGHGRLSTSVDLDRTWVLRVDRKPKALVGPLEEEASSAVGAYGMLRQSRWPARATPRSRRE